MTPRLSPRARLLLIGAIGALAIGCAEQLTFIASTATSASSTVTTTPSVVVGTIVTPSPGVKVLDQKGNGMPGVQVDFSVSSSNGVLTGVSTRTGTDGSAAVGSWTLPTLTGTYTMAADVVLAAGTQHLTLTVKGIAAAPDTMLLVTGSGQSAVVGAGVATPLAVQVKEIGRAHV